MNISRITTAVAALTLTFGCSSENSDPKPEATQRQLGGFQLGAVTDALPLPATKPVRVPFVSAGAQNDVLLSWMEEEAPKKQTLKFARWNGETWSEPHTIASSDQFFVNWADTPSIVESSDGLYAHWLQKSGSGKYSYDINIARSIDGGKSWSKPAVPHANPVNSEYGFVTMLPEAAGGVALTWLDGRNMIEEGVGTMAIRFAKLDVVGKLSNELVLDERTCECCQTGMTRTTDGHAVVYRDRSETEVRDMALVRVSGSAATKPLPVHADGWVIPGCPVNGPQVDSVGKSLAVAWYTESGGTSRVRIAFSNDGGVTFGKPVDLSVIDPLGRVDLVMLDEKTAAVSWMVKRGEVADVRVQLVTAAGPQGSHVSVGNTSSARASGFPRMVRFRDNLVIAWTVPGDPTTIVMKKVEIRKS